MSGDKMKSKLLILLIFSALQVVASERNNYMGIRSKLRTKSWGTVPSGFPESDLRPAPFTFFLGKQTSVSGRALELDISLSYLSSDTYTGDIYMGWLSPRFFGNMFRMGFGGEYFKTMLSDDSIYHETAFDHDLFGFHLKAEYFLSDKTTFYARIVYRYLTETTISKTENITTKTDHDTNTELTLGGQTSFGKFMLMAELSSFEYGDTVVLSREFGLRLESMSVSRYLVGVGFKMGTVDAWVKYSTLSDFDDEVSLFTVAPHFGPDYMLGKSKVDVEFIWNF